MPTKPAMDAIRGVASAIKELQRQRKGRETIAVIAAIVVAIMPMMWWLKLVLVLYVAYLAVGLVWSRDYPSRDWPKSGKWFATVGVLAFLLVLSSRALVEPDTHPAIGMALYGSKEPALAVYNNSDVPIRGGFSYTTLMVNLDAANPDAPLPIRTRGGDFVAARSMFRAALDPLRWTV